MKGIKDLLTELKSNKHLAKKLGEARSISEIVCVAKKNGYTVEKEDLEDLDLSNVSGGIFNVDVSVDERNQNISNSAIVIGNNSTAVSSPNINQSIKK